MDFVVNGIGVIGQLFGKKKDKISFMFYIIYKNKF